MSREADYSECGCLEEDLIPLPIQGPQVSTNDADWGRIGLTGGPAFELELGVPHPTHFGVRTFFLFHPASSWLKQKPLQ